MTISAARLLQDNNPWKTAWPTQLDDASSTAKETPGAIRYDIHPVFGLRGFEYLRCDVSGGVLKGELQSRKANVTITNISSGTTTTITTSGLTANIHVGALLYCADDAGGAGAAPEGECGVIVENSATVVRISSDDAFSVSPAANDDFVIVTPWATKDAAANDTAATVVGVPMADLDQYEYGWHQFLGINPSVITVAAGTALPVGESLIAGTALLTDGAGATIDLRIGKLLASVASDQVVRKAVVDLFCGRAFGMSNSTA